jgi:hypothetical protein
MSTGTQEKLHKIGTLNEKVLHAALKGWYAQPNDQIEVSVNGFFVDIVQDDILVEIQVRNFSAVKRKLIELTLHHPVRLVYPIVLERWIVKVAKNGQNQLSRRKSPQKGSLECVFEELVSFPKLFLNPNFSMDVLFIHEEEVRRYDGTRGWRQRGWITQERRLLRVVDRRLFETPSDFASFIPCVLDEPFTTSDLAIAIGKPNWLAQKMAYCLREMDTIAPVGKHGNAILYRRVTI